MAKDGKQQKQALALGGVLVIIVGVLLWQYGRKFLPQPEPPPEKLNVSRLEIPSKSPSALFERKDYLDLKTFGDVPVRPMQAQSSNPFAQTSTR